MNAKLASVGVKSDLVVIPGGNHGVSGAGGKTATRPAEFVERYLLHP